MDEAERYFNQNDMAASHVKETHMKCKDATWKHAQFAKIIQDMQDFVLRGQSFVLTVSSFRAAVKSHADYANGVPKLQLSNDNDGWRKMVSLSPTSFYEFFDVHAYKNSYRKGNLTETTSFIQL